MINNIEKYSVSLYYTLGLLCFGLFLLQRIPGLSLKIGHAFPLLLLPAVVCVACFLREWTGFWFGMVCGMALDTVTNGSTCFNTIALMIIGVLSGLAFHYVFNRNIKSAMIAGVLFSFLYYLARWFFLCLLRADPSAVKMLTDYSLPSALYTAVFVIPFFFFLRWITARHLVQKG